MHHGFKLLAIGLSTFIGCHASIWAVGYVYWAYLQTVDNPTKIMAFLVVLSTFAILAGTTVWQLWVWRETLCRRRSLTADAASGVPSLRE